MDHFINYYQKDSTIYRGTNDTSKVGYWFTDNIKTACKYSEGKGGIEIYKVKDYLKLINIDKINPKNLSNEKNIKISNSKEIILYSLRELFSILFGKGLKKTNIKNKSDIEELRKLSNKFNNTQHGKYFKLINFINDYDINKYNEKFNKEISQEKSYRSKHTRINDFVRLSQTYLDKLFVKQLKKQYPNTDGFISSAIPRQIPSTYASSMYAQPFEIALNNLTKIKLVGIIYDYTIFCKIFNMSEENIKGHKKRKTKRRSRSTKRK